MHHSHKVVSGTSRHVLCVQYILCCTKISHQTFSFNLLLFVYVCVSAWLCWNSCFLYLVFINVREHSRGNQKWTILGYTRHKTKKTKTKKNKNTTSHHTTQTRTNNVNRIWAIPHTTRGKDDTNVVYMQKSQRTSQHGTQHVKADNRTTQSTKQMSITDPTKQPGVNSSAREG